MGTEITDTLPFLFLFVHQPPSPGVTVPAKVRHTPRRPAPCGWLSFWKCSASVSLPLSYKWDPEARISYHSQSYLSVQSLLNFDALLAVRGHKIPPPTARPNSPLSH